ncbi:MAG: ATP-binding cassette domain-containing protein [Candidatus Cloacimonadaceae bacterium]|nr:ATP-binding cassette domain-containing protein [Candidatus Cloacimonadaceae bacterium]
MKFPWQKVSKEEIDRAFADKSIGGHYDDQYVLLQKVNKVYGNKFHAVYDFSLCIKKKEFVVFVGPSGCGKSTTLRMIAGLEDISSGNLFINGEFANNLLAKDRDIAMVFQNYALYPNMTVFDNMAFALKVKRFSKELIKQRVEEAAKILEISDQLKKKPKELSGGQRQRVALGRAIVRNARIFLMDEPLSNLDAKLRVQMRSEIIDLHRKLNATTIYVTHDQTEAMTMADRIVVMKDGYIQQIGTPMEIYKHPRNLFVASFIGSPAMNLVHGVYDKGVITFPNGQTITLSSENIKKHDHFYAQKYADETKAYPAFIEKLNKEKAAFNAKRHLLHYDVAEFEQKYKKLFDEKNELITKLGEIIHDNSHEIVFGIRPESIVMVEPDDQSAMNVKVRLSELLGDQYFIHFDYGDKNFLSKVNAEHLIETGVEMTLKIVDSKIHVFDPISGLTII